jgi:hypothetical protein
VPTTYAHYDDVPHAFLSFSRLTRRTDEALALMASELTKRL